MVIGKPSSTNRLSRMWRLVRTCAVSSVLVFCSDYTTAQGKPPAANAPPVASLTNPMSMVGIDARLDASETTARFQIILSGPVDIVVETLAQPMRIVVDMPEVNFQAASGQRRTRGLVNGFRAGLIAPGRSRIVFDLGAAAKVAAIRQERSADGIVRLQIDFASASVQEFEAAVVEGANRRAAAALAPLQMQPRVATDRRPLVVIDPGHGGIDPGAVAGGNVAEKALVLAIGVKLKEQLEAAGTVRVVMTRSDDRFLSLSERVRIAREAKADLFVSLHADSLSAAQEVRGATVYTGSEKATDAESARLAQKENAADALGGAETGLGGEAVMDILMDLARRETRAQSGAAAARLVTEMSGAIKMHRIPQRAAGFRVLTAPDVPSILIELGFLSSKSDIALLTSADWQRTAADTIARAIAAHFSPRAGNQRRGASISP